MITAVLAKGEGKTRKAYRDKLVFERLTGRYCDSFSSAYMKWGMDQEPVARKAYSDLIGVELIKPIGRSHPTLYSGASPDLELDPNGIGEIKCPDTPTHIGWMLDGVSPTYYWAQMQWQLACYPERTWNQFISFDPRLPDKAKLFVAPKVYRDEKWIANAEAEVKRFSDEVDEMVKRILAQ